MPPVLGVLTAVGGGFCSCEMLNFVSRFTAGDKGLRSCYKQCPQGHQASRGKTQSSSLLDPAPAVRHKVTLCNKPKPSPASSQGHQDRRTQKCRARGILKMVSLKISPFPALHLKCCNLPNGNPGSFLHICDAEIISMSAFP